MAKAKKGDKVKVHYSGKLDDESVFDTSSGKEPLEFTVGGSEVIPAFEEAVIGMDTGEKRTTKIPADKAYGPYRDELAVEVERSQFPAGIEPKVGEQLELQGADEGQEDQTLVVTITEVSDATVKLDANHPLAGKDLTFDIELVEII